MPMAYEGLAFLNHSDLYGIRNSADVFLKLFLAYVGIHGFFAFGAAMIVALLLFRVLGGGPRFGSIRLGVLAMDVGGESGILCGIRSTGWRCDPPPVGSAVSFESIGADTGLAGSRDL